jgi:hypothetical protein
VRAYERALKDMADAQRMSARATDLARRQSRLARQTAQLYRGANRRNWR